MAATPGLDNESLATEQEAELIEQVRSKLSEELSELKAAGHDFPHTTGDIFMLRVLRGNFQDVDKAVDWYRGCLKLRRENGLDEIHKKCVKDGIPCKADALPNASKVRQLYNCHVDVDALRTTSGHLIWYDSVGDIQSEELLKELDQVNAFMLCLIERRNAAVDELSRQSGRLVKTVRVMDFEGFSPWTSNRELIGHFRSHWMPVAQGSTIEIFHRLYLINCSWFAVKIIGLFKPLLAERSQKRLVVLGPNFLECSELLQQIPGSVLQELLSTRRVEGQLDASDLEGVKRVIHPGQIMAKTVQVQKGQTISWEFQMDVPNGDGQGKEGSSRGYAAMILDASLGEATDVKFSVDFWPEEDSRPDVTAETAIKGEVIVQTSVVDVKRGVVAGSAVAACKGVIVLRWSNFDSWVRPKLVSHYKITVA